jgi:hypothetical protein
MKENSKGAVLRDICERRSLSLPDLEQLPRREATDLTTDELVETTVAEWSPEQ